MKKQELTAAQDPTDPISYLCALLALGPQALCLTYAILLYVTRELEIGLMLAGQLACEALNLALKRTLKGARPPRMHALGKGYGMPSSHAQFVAYWAVYLGLWVWVRHIPATPHTTAPASADASKAKRRQPVANVKLSEAYRLQLQHPRLTHAILSLAAAVLALATAASRVYLEYHTPAQVLVGLATGAACAGAWFGVTEVARRMGLFEWLLDLWIVRWARIRDLCCEDDLVEIGWQRWEEKRALRQAARLKTA